MGKKIKANRLVSTLSMPRDEWLHWRLKGLGGSDVAVAAGVSPFKGIYELWLEKTEQHKPKFKPEQLERMEFGNLLEPVISDFFAGKNPNLKVEKRNCIFQHPTIEWALCNVDRVIYDPESESWGILECKNIGEWAYRLGDWDDDQVPFYYMCQMQHMMSVLDLDWGFFAYFIGGNKYGQQFVRRDNELIADLSRSCSNFWSLVQNKIEPDVDAFCGSALSERYEPKDEAVDLSLDVDVIKELRRAFDAKTEAENQYKLAQNKVKRLLEGAQIGLLGDHKVVTWKESTQNRLDTSRLKKEQPDIANQYMKQINVRTFKPNWKGVEI